MDPCHFLRIMISNLAIKLPTTTAATPTAATATATATPPPSYHCKIKLSDFPHQTATIPILPSDPSHINSISACFTLTSSHLQSLFLSKKHKRPLLKIDVYSQTSPQPLGCRFGFGFRLKLLGRVSVPIELTQQAAEGKSTTVLQNGWVAVGARRRVVQESDLGHQLYLCVKAQPDPRFVFELDGEPVCSPQVFQVQGNIRQPVFTCRFSFRHSADSNLRSSATMSEPSTSKSWLSLLKHDKNQHQQTQVKERKGWSITIHDLSGSPVAAASMVTPFVPSQGTDRVSRSNPGAWLILRPGDGTWKPWGRLEAWRDRAGLGYKFEVLTDTGPTMGTLAQSNVPARSGGKFSIDITNGASPSGSPNGSFDFTSWTGSGSTSSSGSEIGPGSGWWPGLMYKGFVMSSMVGGEEGRKGRKKAVVEIGSQHVTCTEDAAVFVALAAAMDLSVDACRPFSQKLRKVLRQLSGEFVV